MKLLAEIFGDKNNLLLNTKNIRNLLLKDPKAFSNIRFVKANDAGNAGTIDKILVRN